MLLLKAFFFLVSSTLGLQHPLSPSNQAPVLMTSANDGVTDRYIVVLKKSVGLDKNRFEKHLNFAQEFTRMANIQQSSKINKINDIYDSALFGYSATLDEYTLDFLRYSEDIEYIEQDKYTELYSVQTPSTWGLQRISQRGLSVSPYSYTYNPNGGNGVTVYVLDSGININHVDFEGRASFGTVTVPNENNTDCAGHGTHVAGIIGSKTFGVAKKVNLISVKVYNCEGTGFASYTISGINWAINDHVAKTKAAIANKMPLPKSIINSSSGSSLSSALSTAVEAVVNNGLFFVNAAGSKNDDACQYSPSSSPFAFTVGAIDQSDVKLASSNFGKCVSIFAPGSYINSTFIRSNTDTIIQTGTSMSSAFAAGVFAVAQSTSGKLPYSYTTLRAIVTGNATTNAVQNGNNSPNLIAYTIPFM